MCNDLFTLFGLTVHGYGLMIALGIAAALVTGFVRAGRRGLDANAVVDIALLCAVCGFAGAKLLYVLVELPAFLDSPWRVLGSSGFVVYGGVIAGALAAYIHCRKKKLAFIDYFDLLMPSVALAQGFGRIGCFLAGCCYGRPTDAWWGVVFPQGGIAPAGVPLVPTQLLSAGGDLLLAAFLCSGSAGAQSAGATSARRISCFTASGGSRSNFCARTRAAASARCRPRSSSPCSSSRALWSCSGATARKRL